MTIGNVSRVAVWTARTSGGVSALVIGVLTSLSAVSHAAVAADVAEPAQGTIELTPSVVAVGDRLRAEGEASCPKTDSVLLRFGEVQAVAEPVVIKGGVFVAQLVAPESAGAHTLVASCSEDPSVPVAQGDVKVVAPALSLDRRRAFAGDSILVQGVGFSARCAKSLTLAMDGLPIRPSADNSTVTAGLLDFAATVAVPGSAAPGIHELTATCAAGAFVEVTPPARLTVVGSAAAPSAANNRSAAREATAPSAPMSRSRIRTTGIITLGSLGSLAILVAVVVWMTRSARRPKRSRWDSPAVQAEGHADELPEVHIERSTGMRSRAVRLEPHSEQRTVTIEWGQRR